MNKPSEPPTDISDFTGFDAGYDYKSVLARFSPQEMKDYCASLRARFALLTKNWNTTLHAEWTMRHYLATKMILSATVLVTSQEYATTKNLRIVEPYLAYYATLCCCRAITFTLPEQSWNGGKLMTLTHEKIINLAASTVGSFSKKQGEKIKSELETLRWYREMFSYKFPAQGLKGILGEHLSKSLPGLVELLRLLCEIAQMNSECLHASLTKNVKTKPKLDSDILASCFEYELSGKSVIDQDDWYRIDHICRRIEGPVNLKWHMTDGLIDDFFGAWLPDEDHDEDAYVPDTVRSPIFDL